MVSSCCQVLFVITLLAVWGIQVGSWIYEGKLGACSPRMVEEPLHTGPWSRTQARGPNGPILPSGDRESWSSVCPRGLQKLATSGQTFSCCWSKWWWILWGNWASWCTESNSLMPARHCCCNQRGCGVFFYFQEMCVYVCSLVCIFKCLWWVGALSNKPATLQLASPSLVLKKCWEETQTLTLSTCTRSRFAVCRYIVFTGLVQFICIWRREVSLWLMGTISSKLKIFLSLGNKRMDLTSRAYFA